MERLRLDNFGMRSMGPRSTPEEFGRDVEAALARYDAADAARVSERVRAAAGRARLVAEFVELYESGDRGARGERRATRRPRRAPPRATFESSRSRRRRSTK